MFFPFERKKDRKRGRLGRVKKVDSNGYNEDTNFPPSLSFSAAAAAAHSLSNP
jgi:hypothetical protein